MGINSETVKFKEELIKLINNSNLPPANIQLVLDFVMIQVEQYLRLSIQKENSMESQVKEDGDCIS